MSKSIKIYGYGWVGKAMETLFPEAYIVDPAQGREDTSLRHYDIAFVCVPTPHTSAGTLDTTIVEDVVAKSEEDLIIIRSTVNPGTCDYLQNHYGKRIVMQPEYLGETTHHPMTDQKSRPFLIIGGNLPDRREVIELYQSTYNANVSIRQATNYEAEVIKLTENRAIAFKVAQCQELYDACEKAKIDYYTIRDAVYGDDPRFNLWWTFVYPEKRGMNSKCIPKDVYAWAAWAESLGYEPKVTRAILEKNKEWISNSQS